MKVSLVSRVHGQEGTILRQQMLGHEYFSAPVRSSLESLTDLIKVLPHGPRLPVDTSLVPGLLFAILGCLGDVVFGPVPLDRSSVSLTVIPLDILLGMECF
jgi:hypothetical protein